MITLHLPPVTYEGGLVIRSRAVSLTGSTLGDARTTFTGPVRIDLSADTWICDLRGIDFRGVEAALPSPPPPVPGRRTAPLPGGTPGCWPVDKAG